MPIKGKINKEDNTKFCITCEKWVPYDPEHWHMRNGKTHSNHCKECFNKQSRERARKTRETDFDNWIVYQEPYKYKNERQKQQTEEFLTKIGWEFNPNNGIWYKDGIKDENGNWLVIPDDAPEAGSHHLTPEEAEFIKLNWKKTVFKYEDFMSEFNVTRSKIERAIQGRHSLKPKLSEDEIQEMIKNWHSGLTIQQIARKMNKIPNVVAYRINKYKEQNGITER